jgi:hypothetical protein
MTSHSPIVTLVTDFGTKDSFVGTLKGVIWSICPSAHIADICHEIPPRNVLAGALMLGRTYPFFPRGSVHLAVVDPGVGTSRRPVALRFDGHLFVGPDNGLFTAVLKKAAEQGKPLEIISLDNEKYFLPKVSSTFHGRDLFAPVAAHLANGVPLAKLGPSISDLQCLSLPEPEKVTNGWHAHITVIDIFGNCTTDLLAEYLTDRTEVIFRVKGYDLHGLVTSYGHAQPGELIALVNSENLIEIAVANGSASDLLGARVGDLVEVVE